MAFEVVELEVLKHPRLLRRLARVRAAIHRPIGPLTGTIARSAEPVGFAARHTLAARPVRTGSVWGTAHGCAWFHLTAALPASVPPGLGVAAIVDTDGEALVLTPEGEAVAAVTSRLTPIERHGAVRGKTRLDLIAADGAPTALGEKLIRDGRVEMWLDAGFNGKLVLPLGIARVRDLSLVTVDPEVEALYYDLLAVSYAVVAAEGSARRALTDALERFDRAWADQDKGRHDGRESLRPVLHGRTDGSLHVTAIGHGHLDMAWLWPLRETRRKALRTMVGQVGNLARYPWSTYGVSQPQQLRWIEQDDPTLFAQVREAVAGGRLEVQGGFWIEPDTNLPSGESLVRQAIHGQRYWESRFGRRARMCWLPDAFGYSAALPQILRGAGMEFFSTIKLAWNEHNDFPHRSFTWRGLDGSEVLVHMPPEGSYNSSGSGLGLAATKRQYPERHLAPEALLVYGSGDGGGGPGPAHLETVARHRGLTGYPAVQPGTAEGFFERLAAYAEALPTHAGELYLEKHQGTLTTQAQIKAANRRIEHDLHDLEYLAALAWWERDHAWPGEALDEVWEEVLLHQFHDMLPGSSIERVHRESREMYQRVSGIVAAERDSRLVNEDAPEAVVNTTGVSRRGFVRRGEGWARYDVAPFSVGTLHDDLGEDTLELTDTTMANELLTVRFGQDGTISSLVDRRTGRQHCGDYLNRLVLHRDPWTFFDAWDIAPSSITHSRALTPDSVETFRDGPRVVRRQVFSTRRSRIEQDLVLTPGQPYLLAETRVDWHETFRMLRAEHRPAGWADEVSCEIQFGHIRRSTRNDTPQERAQYEICAHRWVDVTDPRGFGLAVLNDGKYGHRVKEGVISLNLLRSPVYPDRHADRGQHAFRYALMPHEGTVEEAGVIEAGRDLNAPLIVARTPERGPVFEVSNGVALDAVTRSADGEALILRLHEQRGHATTAHLRINLPHSEIREVTLLEDDLGPVDPQRLEFGPFQVRTVRVSR